MVKLKGKGCRSAPLDDYDLESWWQKGDQGGARPFVGGASYLPSNTPVVIKRWTRRGAGHAEVLHEIWRDARGQINRVKGRHTRANQPAHCAGSLERDPSS